MLDAPLEGIRVVALEQAVAMPFCTWMLAELGADVIKIERPGSGDVVRGWDSAVKGMSTGFVWVNGGKRDIAVDLSRDEGREVVRSLVLTADVFVENFSPGVVERLGLDALTLRAEHPALIHCSLSGYGRTGPYHDNKAYDLLIQGESGILLTNGSPEEPAKVGLPISDLVGGSTAAIGILAAVLQRRQTGDGASLDLGMLDSVLPWLGYFPHHYWHGGFEAPRTGMRHQYLCPYGPYLASDRRYVNIVVASAGQWQALCADVLRRPHLLNDSRFADVEARKSHRPELENLIEEAISTLPSDVWFDRLARARLPYGQVKTIGEVVTHPQVLGRQMITRLTSSVGQLPLMRFPLAPNDRRRHLPDLGEDTNAVLQEIGYSVEAIARLRAAGSVA